MVSPFSSVLFPRLMAGLPVSNACVCVGPPLNASGPSCGLIAAPALFPPMKLSLASGVLPDVGVNPVPLLRPIRLFVTVNASPPSGDFRTSAAVAASVFPATMLLRIVNGDEELKMAPPLAFVAAFCVNVL